MNLLNLGFSTSLRAVFQSQQVAVDRVLPVMFPVISLVAYWAGGEALLVYSAVAMPMVFLLATHGTMRTKAMGAAQDGLTGLMRAAEFARVVDSRLDNARKKGATTACLMVEIDGYDAIERRHGPSAAEAVLQQAARQIVTSLRSGDTVARVDQARFAICLDPVRRLDLEIGIQMAARLQAAIEAPTRIDGATIFSTGSVGFCLASRLTDATGPRLIEAAKIALSEALRHGPASIRAYSEDIRRGIVIRDRLTDEVTEALENGDIRAWFQPQVSTDTGEVTGFEALARWEHPDLGPLAPAQFLGALERAGQLERLGQVMLRQSLTALRAWDDAGYSVPCVGVNFSGDELHNPALIDKIQWELDLFDTAPERLAVEVLETVMAGSGDDVVSRNINGLAKLGCRIDLDDFGTGNASITSIRRFRVSRLKIDRSFVIGSDRDGEQRKVIHAIITMAERLGLETLAEGVETAGEHAILAQLGCRHVQGFGIARPMRFSDTMAWMDALTDSLRERPKIGRSSG